jgi:hypothetical protein
MPRQTTLFKDGEPWLLLGGQPGPGSESWQVVRAVISRVRAGEKDTGAGHMPDKLGIFPICAGAQLLKWPTSMG